MIWFFKQKELKEKQMLVDQVPEKEA